MQVQESARTDGRAHPELYLEATAVAQQIPPQLIGSVDKEWLGRGVGKPENAKGKKVSSIYRRVDRLD
jgi:hypothetical protein